MAKYKLKYWFEWGCETPFWPNDNYTFDELGTPIYLDKLPLSENLKKDLEELCEIHNSVLDWSDPTSESLWTDNQKVSFDNKAKSLFNEALDELGDNYELSYAHNEFNDENLPVIERLISTDERDYYTHMLEILEALNLPDNFLCLTTDVDHNLLNYDYAQIFNEEYHLFTVSELLRILREEDFQWNWGMLSIFEPKYAKEDILKYELPFVFDGNSDLFLEYPVLQHPLSFVEIAAFDSSYVIFTTKVHGYIDIFKKLFPKAIENF